MVDKRYRRFVQSFLLVFPMTGIVCVVNTVVAKNIAAVFTAGLLLRWGVSCVVAFPCVLVMAPLAARLTDRLVKPAAKGET
jgi:hypothetical protein